MNARMPTLFFGHGSPMNAVEDNPWSKGWRAIGQGIPKPKAILSISAHWYVPTTAVTANARPKTIHDFGGFPPELFAMQYPAPGDTGLVERIQEILKPLDVGADHAWGLDHGTWSVLCHVYPNADIPVVQLSIDSSQPPAFHYALGRQLRPLRDEGILIMGSGDVVHNLHSYAWGRHPVAPFDWAARFEALCKQLMEEGDHTALTHYEALGRDAELSIPTPEHYLPLLYILGASHEDEAPSYPVEGMDGGSISMLTVQYG